MPSRSDPMQANPEQDAAPVDVASEPAEPRGRSRRLPVLGALAVLLVAAAVLLGLAWNAARGTGPTTNEAFVDGAATAEVVGQVTSAIVTVYSYNYTTLDTNEAAAKGVITGKFAAQYDRIFQPVKQLAPQQQASVRTTVPAAAVSLLQGDRARLLMMVDQSGVQGPNKEATGVSARLVVDVVRVEGHWKIEDVKPE